MEQLAVSETIAVLGVGYVGLPTATCLASFGHSVCGYDNNPEKIRNLSNGVTPMLEPGLQSLLREGLSSNRLRFTTSLVEAVDEADIVFLCLPTPQLADGAANVEILHEATLEIRDRLKGGAILVIKSSVPMGESVAIERLLAREDVHLVSNPEFLREGFAIHDTLNPGRIVAGAKEESISRRIGSLFQPGNAPMLVTDNVTAETIKYVSNAFLAAKTSFINQVTNLCEVVGADGEDVIEGMSLDPRIGTGHMRPSPGWGGPCLTKDSHALLSIGLEHGFEFTMVRAAIEANDYQLASIVQKVRKALGGELNQKSVAIWGLTFKADTDDLRNSPAIEIAQRLASKGVNLQAFDPIVKSDRKAALDFLVTFEDPYEACEGAEVLLILTEWSEFKFLDFEKVGALLSSRTVIDARNILDPRLLRSLGFTYVGLGR